MAFFDGFDANRVLGNYSDGILRREGLKNDFIKWEADYGLKQNADRRADEQLGFMRDQNSRAEELHPFALREGEAKASYAETQARVLTATYNAAIANDLYNKTAAGQAAVADGQVATHEAALAHGTYDSGAAATAATNRATIATQTNSARLQERLAALGVPEIKAKSAQTIALNEGVTAQNNLTQSLEEQRLGLPKLKAEESAVTSRANTAQQRVNERDRNAELSAVSEQDAAELAAANHKKALLTVQNEIQEQGDKAIGRNLSQIVNSSMNDDGTLNPALLLTPVNLGRTMAILNSTPDLKSAVLGGDIENRDVINVMQNPKNPNELTLIIANKTRGSVGPQTSENGASDQVVTIALSDYVQAISQTAQGYEGAGMSDSQELGRRAAAQRLGVEAGAGSVAAQQKGALGQRDQFAEAARARGEEATAVMQDGERLRGDWSNIVEETKAMDLDTPTMTTIDNLLQKFDKNPTQKGYMEALDALDLYLDVSGTGRKTNFSASGDVNADAVRYTFKRMLDNTYDQAEGKTRLGQLEQQVVDNSQASIAMNDQASELGSRAAAASQRSLDQLAQTDDYRYESPKSPYTAAQNIAEVNGAIQAFAGSVAVDITGSAKSETVKGVQARIETALATPEVQSWLTSKGLPQDRRQWTRSQTERVLQALFGEKGQFPELVRNQQDD